MRKNVGVKGTREKESYGFLGIIPKSRWKEQEKEKTQTNRKIE